ncbi:MAG: internal scaffolding protein [Microviridae sp.]|nr:MAG: internal scaffolding protein [Microviridae sp.]
MKFRTAYDPDADDVSRKTSLDCSVNPDTGEESPSMTQQQFAAECDINEIVRRFGLTGELPDGYRPPVSGDFTNVGDFQSAMNAVRQAEESFMALPAGMRERFNNDPQQLIDFVSNDKNRDEAMELGLVPRPPERTRDVVQAVDELAAKMNVTPKA